MRPFFKKATSLGTLLAIIAVISTIWTPGIVNADAQTPVKLVFITAPQTCLACEMSGNITIQVQDAKNNPVPVPNDICIVLSCGGNGAFDFFPTSSFDHAINFLYIKAGSDSANFYFKSSIAGIHTMTATTGGLSPAYQDITILPGTACKLVFSTEPQNINLNRISKEITVEAYDIYDNPSCGCGGFTIHLSSSSPTGIFDTSSSGPFNGSITSVTILPKQTGASFYYRDNSPGTHVITATSTFLVGCSQDIKVTLLPTSGFTDENAVTGLTIQSCVTSGLLLIDGNQRTFQQTLIENAAKNCRVIIPKGTKALNRYGSPLPMINIGNITQAPAAPDGSTLICFQDFGPDGATFDPGITIVFDIDAHAEGFDPDKVQAAFRDGARWQYMYCEVDIEAGTVSIVTTHFTGFAVFTDDTPVPATPPEPVATLAIEPAPIIVTGPVVQNPIITAPGAAAEPFRQPELKPVTPDTPVIVTTEIPDIPQKPAAHNYSLIIGIACGALVICTGFIVFFVKRRRTG